MVISRQERERLVLDLYYNQGENTREIAEKVRMSFRDIGAILDKAQKEKESEEQTQQKSLSTQDYKLFSKDKTRVEVAIALNLREPEVTKFYMEYVS